MCAAAIGDGGRVIDERSVIVEGVEDAVEHEDEPDGLVERKVASGPTMHEVPSSLATSTTLPLNLCN